MIDQSSTPAGTVPPRQNPLGKVTVTSVSAKGRESKYKRTFLISAELIGEQLEGATGQGREAAGHRGEKGPGHRQSPAAQPLRALALVLTNEKAPAWPGALRGGWTRLRPP